MTDTEILQWLLNVEEGVALSIHTDLHGKQNVGVAGGWCGCCAEGIEAPGELLTRLEELAGIDPRV